MTNASRMPRRDLLRRVVILCCSFGRNLAYYRAWWGKEHQHFLSLANNHPIFWRAVNNNFLDMCVLDWCKLFADKRGKHYWGKVVADPSAFEVALLRHLGLDAQAFQNEIDNVLFYRDKFVAHLDLEYTAMLPTFDVPKQAVWFYHSHIVNHEAQPGDLLQLPEDIEGGYNYEEQEARAVYQAIRS